MILIACLLCTAPLQESHITQIGPSYTRSPSDTTLSIEDIKQMSQAGVSDDKIIHTIHSTGSVYTLSKQERLELKEAGVSQRVIDYMIQTAYK